MSDTVIAPDLQPRLKTYRGWKDRMDDPARHPETVSPVLRMLTNDGIDLIERVSKAEQENVALRAKVAKLEAPISAAEVEEFFHKDDWGVPCVYEEGFGRVIAARGREGE